MWLKLKTYDGNDTFVRVSDVERVTLVPDNKGSYVHFRSGKWIEVKEPPRAILAKLNAVIDPV